MGGEKYTLISNINSDTGISWPSSYLGNYRLIRLLGHGGFASVYLGEHQYLKRLAAIKVLRTVLDDPEKTRFLKEAKLLASLSHPHIVRVLEFDIAKRRTVTQNSVIIENIPFLVMDYVASGSLRATYTPGTRFPLETVIVYIKQVADALQYAHDRHVIHRDIKPENLLLNERQEIMLSDFGLALFSPRPGFLSQQEMAGTLPYTAPEQLRGKPVFASDQYSLAIVTYEWLCGQLPFNGVDAEVMLCHFTSAPPPLRNKNASIPQAVEDVIMKALAKDPSQRYDTIQSFALALENAGSKKRYPFVKPLPIGEIPPSQRTTKVLPFFTYLTQKSVAGPGSDDLPPRPRVLKKRKVLLLLASVLIVLFSFVIYAARPFPPKAVSFTTALSMPVPMFPSTIGIAKAPDGELIGISDGTYIFDTSRSRCRYQRTIRTKATPRRYW